MHPLRRSASGPRHSACASWVEMLSAPTLRPDLSSTRPYASAGPRQSSSSTSRRLSENRRYPRTQVTIISAANCRLRNRGARQTRIRSPYQMPRPEVATLPSRRFIRSIRASLDLERAIEVVAIGGPEPHRDNGSEKLPRGRYPGLARTRYFLPTSGTISTVILRKPSFGLGAG